MGKGDVFRFCGITETHCQVDDMAAIAKATGIGCDTQNHRMGGTNLFTLSIWREPEKMIKLSG